jgi:hypothetical protein
MKPAAADGGATTLSAGVPDGILLTRSDGAASQFRGPSP